MMSHLFETGHKSTQPTTQNDSFGTASDCDHKVSTWRVWHDEHAAGLRCNGARTPRECESAAAPPALRSAQLDPLMGAGSWGYANRPPSGAPRTLPRNVSAVFTARDDVNKVSDKSLEPKWLRMLLLLPTRLEVQCSRSCFVS